MIEILTTGALNSVQDTGRFGYLNLGVAQSGAMDATALAVGNLVLGNDPACAALEVAMYPFKLRFTKEQTFAVVGAHCQITLGERVVPPQWVCHAKAGDTLVLQPPSVGVRSYVCFAGGLDVQLVMGSRSTDLKSALGGLEGRGLRRGDTIDVYQSAAFEFSGGVCAPTSVVTGEAEIRVTAASEYSEFSDEELRRFFTSKWTVTQESNRMGIRLAGPTIAPRQKMEMLSHGILPGTVQVPPAGQPIVQMADANTCGGYPKIANVIDVDIARLAQLAVGSTFRFVEVTHDQALQAQIQLDDELYRLRRVVGTAYKKLV
ncbi:biotin-dependent carboxyltransferase family protein [Pseudomonas sp. GD03842]|uniref:5-oxoprolinase subunit C family protein n=1 Tax=unclassified Pseudomonas TaxID=196821 RepID=UPI001313FDEC|nr:MULTISPECIES: biotin-dependent carboxyltransferase family protein [unclassified Pseudomonas]MDH0746932.1 biotin-dependent carboxyltransferase family protein [Pseudomonas sp. GD03842]